MRPQLVAGLMLAALAVFLIATVAERMREGRCHPRGGRFGMDCSYAPAWATGNGSAKAPIRP